jgi:FAM183A and FAM183B related
MVYSLTNEAKLKTKILEAQLTPKMKYNKPVTTSQEIGWLSSNKFNKNFQNHNVTSCAETEFGSAYYAMKGFGPYSNKNNNEFSAGKSGGAAKSMSPTKKK